MNDEEHDDLWDLLGKARRPSVPPLFSRNVLREVRSMEQSRPGVFAAASALFRSWFPHWRMAMTSACAAGLAFGAFLMERDREANLEEHRQIAAIAERVSASPDYQVINHLDELLDSEKDAVWLDSGTSVY